LKLGEEDYAQITVSDWCLANKIPFFHFASERKCGVIYGKILKRKGAKRGVSDCFLPRPNARFHGIWIELKIAPNGLTKEQKAFIEDRKEEGYYAVCCREKTSTELASAAIEVIKNFYLL
jgi:hypothetical protein